MSETQQLVFGSSKSKGSPWTQGEHSLRLKQIIFTLSVLDSVTFRCHYTEAGALPSHLHGKTLPNRKHSRGLLWGPHCPFPQTTDGNSISPQPHCSQECALPADVLLRLTFHASHSLVNISRANSQETESLIALLLVSTLHVKQNKEYKTKTTHCCSSLSFL